MLACLPRRTFFGAQLPAAIGTDPAEVDVVIADLKAVAPDIGPSDLVQPSGFEIDDGLAVHAHEVVMLLDLRIETGHRPGVADPGDDAEPHQSVKGAIHSSSREAMTDSVGMMSYAVSSVNGSFSAILSGGVPVLAGKDAGAKAAILDGPAVETLLAGSNAWRDRPPGATWLLQRLNSSRFVNRGQSRIMGLPRCLSARYSETSGS